jgi:hypothetical protein
MTHLALTFDILGAAATNFWMGRIDADILANVPTADTFFTRGRLDHYRNLVIRISGFIGIGHIAWFFSEWFYATKNYRNAQNQWPFAQA